MSAICRICSHPNRKEIDEALVGTAVRQKIAEKHGVSVRSLGRHLTNHLNEALAPKGLKPWERQPGERSRQWNAFETYLKLCTENQDRDVSYAELARSLGLSPATVRSWAWRYDWKERVHAWLLESTRATLKRLRAQAERSRERSRHLGRQMQNIGAKRLAKIDADKLTPEEARRFILDGSALERRGFEGVLETPADGHRPQVNVQINIDSDHARRVIELHESRRQLESEVSDFGQENEQGDS